jgi:tetratricopeptide (TPR) repeat protein
MNPKFAEAYISRGELRRVRRELDEALSDYNRAIELKPDLAAAYANRGLLKKDMDDLAGAQADEERALDLKPDSAETRFRRGKARMMGKDWAGAVEQFTRAIDFNPDFAQAYSNRGAAKNALGDIEGAIVDIEKALELKPNSSDVDQMLRVLSKQARQRARKPGAADAELPETEATFAVRTCFSDEAAWKGLCAAIQNPDAEFSANVEFVSDPKYQGLTAKQLLPLVPGDSKALALIIDEISLSNPEYPILVVDLQEEQEGRFG